MIDWQAVFTSVLDAITRPVRPRVVDDALAVEYDVAAYHEAHGGEAPADAPHIEEGGI